MRFHCFYKLLSNGGLLFGFGFHALMQDIRSEKEIPEELRAAQVFLSVTTLIIDLNVFALCRFHSELLVLLLLWIPFSIRFSQVIVSFFGVYPVQPFGSYCYDYH